MANTTTAIIAATATITSSACVTEVQAYLTYIARPKACIMDFADWAPIHRCNVANAEAKARIARLDDAESRAMLRGA